MRIAVTGATGFVGQAVVKHLRASGHELVCISRSTSSQTEQWCDKHYSLDLEERPDLRSAFADVEVVVHLAARVHVMRENSSSPNEAYRKANVEATEHLAQEAARAGVRRLVYLSSIKVNGERTLGKPFSSADKPQPLDPYGESKYQAEVVLAELAQSGTIQVITLRPPLVYGPNVRANFLRLLKLVDKGWPVPLASVHNGRSMIYVKNLADAIATAVLMPLEKGAVFTVSDDEVFSTSQLLRTISAAMGRSARLVSFPTSALKLLGRVLGQRSVIDRLVDDLVVDNTDFKLAASWKPPVSAHDGIKETVQWYLSQSR